MYLEPLMNLQEDRCLPKEKKVNILAVRSEVDVSCDQWRRQSKRSDGAQAESEGAMK